MTSPFKRLDDLVPGDIWFQEPLPIYIREYPGQPARLTKSKSVSRRTGPVFVVAIQRDSFDDETMMAGTVQYSIRFRARFAVVITQHGVFETHLKEAR